MKSRVLIGMAVAAFLFIQEAAAQEVSRVLQSKEKRQMLYATIINDEEKYQEFLELAKISGKMDDKAEVVEVENMVEADVEEHPAVAGIYESYENQEVMDQMVDLMKELVEKDPEFQKVINERCPQMGRAMRED